MRLYLFLLLIITFFTACGNNNQLSIKQKQLSIKADSASRQKFKTLEFMIDNKPALAIIDTRYQDFKDKKEFSLSLFITINTLDKDKNGHPTKKESEAYSFLETDVIKELDQKIISAFIGRTTMNSYRDLIFYIKPSDQKKVSDLLTGLQKKHSRIKEFVFENDPEWVAVADFYTAIEKVK